MHYDDKKPDVKFSTGKEKEQPKNREGKKFYYFERLRQILGDKKAKEMTSSSKKKN